MSSIAKHIRVARTVGVEAGLEAYLAAPSSRRHPAYAAIMRKRTPETQLKAYCSLFAAKIGEQPSRTPVIEERVNEDVQAIIEAVLAQLNGGNDEAEDEPEVVEGTITRGAAWAALNGPDGDFPKPANPDEPANNGQLFRLNKAGMLRIVV